MDRVELTDTQTGETILDRSTRNELAALKEGLLQLRGLPPLVVRSPAPADDAFLMTQLREMAIKEALTPLQAIAKDFEQLPPALQKIVGESAVAQQAGNGGKRAEPTQEQITAQIWKPEAVRLWVWRLAKEPHPCPALLDELGKAIVTEADAIEALALLRRATGVDRAFPLSSGRTSSGSGEKETGQSSSAT